MKILILVGANGGIGKNILEKSLNYFDKTIAIDQIIPSEILTKKLNTTNLIY